MQFSIDAKVLHDALAGHVARRSTMSIIEHALLIADAATGTLRLATTDTEKYVSHTLMADVHSSGMATLDPTQLKVSTTGLEGALRFTCDNQITRIAQGRRRFTLNGHDPEEWPGFKEEDGRPWSIDREELAAAIDAVGYCADATLAQPFATGIYLTEDHGATVNSHRGAYYPLTTPMPGILIPAASVAALRKLLNDEKVAGTVYGGGEKLSAFELFTPEVSIVTRLVVANFPSMNTFITPFHDAAKPLAFASQPARAAMARLKPFTPPIQAKLGIHEMTINTDDGMALVATKHSTGMDEFPADGALEKQISINAAYMSEALQVLGTEVELYQADQPGGTLTMLTAPDRNDMHFIANIRG